MRVLTTFPGCAAGAVFALLGPAGAAPAATYDWTLSGGGDSGSGTLQTGGAAGGGYDILSLAGTIDGQAVALFGGQPGPNGAYTPGNWVYFNNTLYPNSASGSSNCAGGGAVLDGCGIALSIADAYGNIYFNYTGQGSGSYAYLVAPTTYNNFDASFAITPGTSADTYDWTLAGGGDTGSGTLETGAAAGGGYDILSLTGTIDGKAVTLFGGQPGPDGAYTPGDWVYFNNIFYPDSVSGSSSCAGGHAVLDGCGIALSIDGIYGNIYYNYTGNGAGAYAFLISPTSYNNFDAMFTIVPVPEPSSVSLFALGAAGVLLIRRRALSPLLA
jgi:PEP-CTERM motif